MSDHDLKDLADRLLSYLRSEIGDRGISFSSAPTPVTGGFDTSIYRFQMAGTPEEISQPLILRIFSRGSPDRAMFESAVQNALANSGYPAPQVFFTSTDVDIFGGSFMVMELMPGHPMVDEPEDAIPEMLARSHLHLHAISVDPIEKALESAGVKLEERSFERYLEWIKDRIETGAHEWLYEGLSWATENRPQRHERSSMIHGDFHPLNILVEDGRISGVLDWSGFMQADPALDVAITRFLGTIAFPYFLTHINWMRLIERYLGYYQRSCPLDRERVDYYEGVRNLASLLEGTEGHRGWGHPDTMVRLSNHFEELTGVAIHLPS